MSGHSKWHNIQHKKGLADAARSGLFTKLAREITMAAKLGDKNPDNNPRLRLAILQARKNSMPNDNIKRAIDKASGSNTENYVAVRYEGYGPGAVPVIVEALTDNPRRTVPEVCNILVFVLPPGAFISLASGIVYLVDPMQVKYINQRIHVDNKPNVGPSATDILNNICQIIRNNT